ncbi:acyl-CoA desaturase [Leucothrix sargassi]|nr:acyl-CoA desaturase [Leucothrix sargassi]
MGLFPDLSVWQLVLITLGLTHITIVSVTVFLHRSQAHNAVTLGPIPYHFFRFWLWLTTGIVTLEWVAIHRKHHAKCETEDDPHSPQVYGLSRVLWAGAFLYRAEAKNTETLEKYGRGTPKDWLENNVYKKHPVAGIVTMLVIDLMLFGWAGLAVWLVQMYWIPFWAAGVINGIAHFVGYRNWSTGDASRNIFPIGILVGGEELHNNHHAFASSARLSNKWYEFDIGWFYIRLMEVLKMAKVNKVAPRLKVNRDKLSVDLETMSAVLGNRLQVISNFGKQVVNPVMKAELVSFDKADQTLIQRVLTGAGELEADAKERMSVLLASNPSLQSVYKAQQQLHELWGRTTSNQQARLESVQKWVHDAEETGIKSLQDFAQKLRGYSMA